MKRRARTLVATVPRVSVVGLVLLWVLATTSKVFPTGDQGPEARAKLVGALGTYTVRPGDSLMEVARRFDLGFNAIIAANPALDPWLPPPGSRVTLATAWILPQQGTRPGIVVNIPELRLYYFPPEGSGPVLTFPLGVGDQGKDTPLGGYTVIGKEIRPAWHVPRSIRAIRPTLPAAVPPGPDNPLGSHALRLSRDDILIHGTNRPWGIGRRSSHGCLRLYPEDIVVLFRRVPKGTPVTVISEPLKACLHGTRVFLEVHDPVLGEPTMSGALQLLAVRRLLGKSDFVKVWRALEERRGYPVDITCDPATNRRDDG